MYERFTDRARKTMQLANQEAQRLNHEYIGAEHILLGLMKEGGGVAANVFERFGTDADALHFAVFSQIQAGPEMISTGKLPQTPRAKKVIEYAIEESRGLQHNYVGTEHILLGCLREQEGVAFIALTKCGVTIEKTRDIIRETLGGPAESLKASPRDVAVRTLVEKIQAALGEFLQQ